LFATRARFALQAILFISHSFSSTNHFPAFPHHSPACSYFPSNHSPHVRLRFPIARIASKPFGTCSLHVLLVSPPLRTTCDRLYTSLIRQLGPSPLTLPYHTYHTLHCLGPIGPHSLFSFHKFPCSLLSLFLCATPL